MEEEGLKFYLLFNATCYGKDSQSKAFVGKIGETMAYIQEKMGLASITTISPLIAKIIKENFEDIDVRASVNMVIGTVDGMDYVAEYFDSFYLKSGFNRDFEKIAATDNGYAFEGICRKYLRKEENAHALSDYTSNIRPKDVHLYEVIFPAMMLATRVILHPVRILKAYIENQSYTGSVLDLLEPNHTGLF